MLMHEVVALWRRDRGHALLLCLSLLVMPALIGTLAPPAHAQSAAASERKVLVRVEPEYPETLKRLYIGGIVRVETVVAPNGTVESMQLLGGSPVLGQAAMKAIKQWKFAPANAKEKIVVKLEFDPHRE